MVSFKPSPDFFIQKPTIKPVQVDTTTESSATNLHDRYVELEACLKAKVAPPQLPVNSHLLTELDQTIKTQLDEIKSQFDKVSQEINTKHPTKSQAFTSQKVLNALQEIANCKQDFQTILFTLREASQRDIVIQGLSIMEAATRIITILQVIEITENDRLSRSWEPIEEYYHDMCDQSKDIYEVRLDFMNELKVNLTYTGISWDSPRTQLQLVQEKFQANSALQSENDSSSLGTATPIPLLGGNQVPNTNFESNMAPMPLYQGTQPINNVNYCNPAPGLLGPIPGANAHQTGIIHPQNTTGNSLENLQNQQRAAVSTEFRLAQALGLGPEQYKAFQAIIQKNMRNPLLSSTPEYPENFENTCCTEPISKNGWAFQLKMNPIAPFSGEPSDIVWLIWWQRFYQVIHRYDSKIIPDLCKMDALMMCLRGPAKSLAEGYYVSKDTDKYRKLVAALHTRFGDALQARMSIELALQTLQPEGTTAEEYQEYFSRVNYYRNQLVTCGEHPDTAATTAYTKLQSFAPQHAMREFYHELMRINTNISITEKYELLLKWLTLKIQSYCVKSLSELDKQPPPKNTVLPSAIEHGSSNNISPASLMMAPQDSNLNYKPESKKNPNPWVDKKSSYPDRHNPYPRYKGAPQAHHPKGFMNKKPSGQRIFKCVFHESDDHPAKECPFSVPEKVEALIKNKRCKKCLFKGHTKDNCPSKKMCKNCKLNGVESKHNTLICPFESHPQ